MRIEAAVYQRVLGDELRKARKQRGWTRKELTSRLQTGISLQTLATYELGTRQCTIVRFVELCLALEEMPHELMSRVHDRVFAGTTMGRVRVDLRRVVRDDRPELSPLRRWAAGRLACHVGPEPPIVQLDPAALERLAELCRVETVELVRKLGDVR
ncbi:MULTISPECIES: helix-turn-helix domain-containing protein [Actinokineospora]|uniref:Transcriptional regulator n=1 Tax=Actinokineospora fastidiosa TaxID=1816 RepID=A0A918LGC9_9PSEU|nr:MULTISPECIES: helix-turn-helix transcriptional regulator [Actinokineospora]UVS77479.1 anaerobic benzoate catabolism transcriptional regulator [Actinokineospora sp. UTMC 2448]GGS43017.1 transcriptional regulator [Actinokineospora fastidiosa]